MSEATPASGDYHEEQQESQEERKPSDLEEKTEAEEEKSQIEGEKEPTSETTNKKDANGATCSKKEGELEKLFADRYTTDNPSYAQICKGFEPVIVVHPWASRTKRMYDYTRGGGDRGRGWRGGRGGGWRGGRNDYRDRGHDNQRGNEFQRKRRWDENNPGDRSNPRVSYPGQSHR